MNSKTNFSLRSYALTCAATIAIASSALWSSASASATSISTGFTYQGQLRNASALVTGTCDLRFTLFDTATGGAALGVVDRTGAAVSNGLFTVELDFGIDAFTGDTRYLEIAAACPAGGTRATLSPRQPLTAAPYALGLRPGAKVIGSATLGLTSQTTPAETTDCNAAVFGRYGAGSGRCVFIGAGVWGDGGSRFGVAGTSQNQVGVYGFSENFKGVLGVTEGSESPAVEGNNTATFGPANGVMGRSASATGTGVYGLASNPVGTSDATGVHGQTDALKGTGVLASGAGPFSAALAVENGAIRNVGAGLDTPTPVFIHVISKDNLCYTNFATVLSNVYVDRDPSAILFSQPVGTDGGDFVSDSKAVQVMYTGPTGWYDCPANRWILVSPLTGGALATRMRYNVMVIKP